MLTLTRVSGRAGHAITGSAGAHFVAFCRTVGRMPIQRDNDEERAAVIDRLMREHRGQQAREPKASIRTPDGPELCRQPERRRYRSDGELRSERDALERQWNEGHSIGKRSHHLNGGR